VLTRHLSHPFAGPANGNSMEQPSAEGEEGLEPSPAPLRPLSVKVGRPGDDVDVTYEQEAPEEGWDAGSGYMEEDEYEDPLEYLPVKRCAAPPLQG
jgi:hypothetical protein